MSLIYPFHYIEKSYSIDEDSFNAFFVKKNIDLKGLFEKYGKEAVLIAILQHPFSRAEYNESDFLFGWKFMNKLYNFYLNDGIENSDYFDKYLKIAQKALLNHRYHVVVSAFMHIFKTNVCLNSKIDLIQKFHMFFPYFVQHLKK